MLLAFILCFSTLPMTALAQETVQEADVVTEQAGPAAEQEEQQQEEAEAAAAPGAETPADKSTTAAAPGTEDSTVGEATDTVKPTGESVSDSDAGTQDTAENGEKAAEVQAVQKLIDALPETVTEDNAESVSAQLEAIAEAMESLTEEQIAELDMEHLYAISEAMSAPMTVAAQDGTHADHPVCGTSCTDDERHDPVEWTGISSLDEITEDGYYYLKNDISLTSRWILSGKKVNLCLNGHNITNTKVDYALDIKDSAVLSLCNPHNKEAICNGVAVAAGGTFNLYDKVQITNSFSFGVYVKTGGTFIMNGGTICNNHSGVNLNGTLIMNGGSISNNKGTHFGGGVYVNVGGNFTMTGGEISGNTAEQYGGGVYVEYSTAQHKSGTFTVSGNAKIIDNKVGDSTNNVELSDGSKITIAESGLGSNASIGVTVVNSPATTGAYVTVATGKVEGSSDNFSADAGDPYGVMEQDGELVLKNGVPHIHPVCGTTCEDSEKHASVEWTGISSLNEITEDGNYYLKNDISDVGYYWKLKYDINLCLNGHNIKTADNKDCYIDVNASHTLSLCNPHERAASCIGVWVGDKCKFNLYDNVVITRKNNSGVWINYGGTFTMNGGTICNSSGGVVVDNNASFIMNNGRITENTMINSGGGGGVRVNAGGNFTMTGGKISENTATDYGGGVYVDFNTSQLKSGTFTVSGNAKIIDNKVGNSKNNVALCDGSKITIAESGLGSDASIGVSLKKDITEGSYAVIASGANNSNADKITSDSSDYKIQKMGDELLLCTNSTTLHTHPVCGTNCTHTGDDAHSTLTWQGISALSEIKKSGNYYLKNDITLSEVWKVPYDINLCLNGYNITNTKGDYALNIGNSAVLSLCNPHDKDAICGGVKVAAGGTFNLYDKVQITKSWPCGVMVETGGTFIMNGGTICNNHSGVNLYGTLIMNGGSISNNTGINFGGGVWVDYNGNFTMNGGEISGNTAEQYGGGVYVEYSTANHKSGTFIVSGNVKISGNKADGLNNNVGLCDGSKITIGESGLGSNASIGVRLAYDLADGSYAVIANGLDHGYTKKTITSDSISHTTQQVDDELLLYSRSTRLHTHPICGKNCTHTGEDAHGTLIWQGISSLDEIKEAGNYYLKNDISLSKFWEVPYDINLCLNGYQIKNTAGSDYRGYLIHMENKKLSLCNCNTIPVDKSVLNGGVFISGSDSQLDLYRNVKIINSIDTTWPNKSVVRVCGGKFTMYGGTVSGDNKYGGIYVTIEGTSWDTSGTFVMKDGTITGNSGAGVTVYGGSTVIMDGGTITGNVNGSNGGGVYVGYGTFTMNGGTISGNTSYSNGGGVYVDESSKFIMNGGTISNNKTTIRPGNSKPSSGGGVYVGYGKFIMNDGTIENNEAESFGGGIVVAKKGSFDMSGGTITDNKCTSLGSGVYLESNGTFTMKGGSITKNRTKYYNYAGGVYVAEGSKFAVSGTVNITENTRDYGGINMAENVYLQGEAENPTTITIGAGLSEASRIGVSKADYTIYGGKKIKIATGAETGVDYTKIFTADAKDAEYLITRDDEGNVYLGTHQHSWVYTANGAVITAECSGCDAKGGSVTLKAPEKRVYNGNGKTADMTFSEDWQGPAVVDDIPICYEKEDGTDFDEEPINVGTYVAKISINNKSGEPATARVKYTIQKATLTVTARNHKIWYGDEPANIGVTFSGFANDVDETALEFTPKYTYDYTQYGNVGKYNIIPQCPDGLNLDEKLPNYEVSFEPGTLTVEQKEVSLIWDNYENRIYGDESPIRVIIANLVNNDKISAEIAGADLTAGTHTARVTRLTGEKAGNYKLPENPTYTYTVAKAKQTLEFITKVYDITYDSISFKNEFTKTSNYNTDVFYESSDQKVVTVDNNGHSHVVGVGTATITATAVGNENYERVQATYTVNVTPKPVTISGVKANNKTYDGTDAAAFDLTDARIDGIVEDGVADDLKINAANAKAVFEDVNAGTDKTVSFTGFELTGQDAGNYTLSAQPANETADITPATITIIPETGKTKIYGAKDPELTYTYSGEIPGEKPLFTGALGREAGENVGSYVINKGTLALMNNSDGNFSAGNYTLKVSDTPVNFVINRATPEIKVEDKTLVKNGDAVDISTWASFNNTDTDAKLIYTLVGAPAGISLTEDNLLKAEKADTTVESFQITVTADATTNFTAPEEKQFTVQVVEKADAGVKIDAPTSKTYGDADFTLQASTVAADNGTWSWTSSNESILKIVSGAETAAPVIHVVKADAIGATLTATYISDAYYGTASVTIAVNSKTVTAAMIGEVESREYNGGAIMPTPEVKDGETILTPGGDFEFGYSDNTNAGTATLTITGKGNYTGIAEKKFTIEPKNIESAIIVLGGLNRPYTGEEQTVEIVSVTLPDGLYLMKNDDYRVVKGNTATDAAKEIVLTIEGKGNYTGTATTTWAITKAAPKLADFDVVPDLSNELTYSGEEQIVNVTTKAGIRGMGMITVRYNDSTEKPVNVGSYAITIDVADGSNYKAISGIEAGTLTIKKAAAPTLADVKVDHAYATTGNQTVSLAELVKSAKSYTPGEITGNTETEILSDINVTGDGVLQYTLTGKGAAGSTVTIPVTITSMNYEETTVNVVITIKQATPTGAPGYDFVHDSSKTLKDAGLDLINSTLNPKEGTLEWIDSNGKVLPGETKLEEGKKYIWRFTPDNPNYAVITGEVELYAPYRILDGADSTWTQSTDGTIAIRGNGDFEKFQSVKVDGVVVDAKNYTVAKGSTIITFKEDYLKTLSTGSHTFELVWTDGSAATKFSIAAKPDNGDNNNSDNNNNDKNDDSDNDTVVIGNVSSGNNTVPAVIGAPKTGDASGIWMTLFAVSLAGLAAMLVRKKNNRE